jgi:hypothetical protein
VDKASQKRADEETASVSQPEGGSKTIRGEGREGKKRERERRSWGTGDAMLIAERINGSKGAKKVWAPFAR